MIAEMFVGLELYITHFLDSFTMKCLTGLTVPASWLGLCLCGWSRTKQWNHFDKMGHRPNRDSNAWHIYLHIGGFQESL